MNDAKDKLPLEIGQQVSKALEDARAALRKEDPAEWASAEAALTQASSKMAEHLYKASAGGEPGAGPTAGPGAAGGKENPKGGDDVIDADFNEVN
jgi:molecular chaperone DnaK